MLDTALSRMAIALNQQLRDQFGVAEDMVALTETVERDGSPSPASANKLILFLVGIEHSAGTSHATGFMAPQQTGSRREDVATPSLLVMCAANFGGSHYLEGLKVLSAAIRFLDESPALGNEAASGSKLTLRVEAVSALEMNELWRLHGGTYLPSRLYRLRMAAPAA